VNVAYSGYSCSGNGVSTFPFTPDDLCCTDIYVVPSVCVAGYREEDGVMMLSCIMQSTNFYNISANQPSYPSLGQNLVAPVVSFDGGLTATFGGGGGDICYPFRQLTTDTWVSNLNSPAFQTGNAACPEYPNPTVSCDALTGQANSFAAARRRIPASRNNGYHVTKNFNTKGSCNSDNSNCDWFVGSWDGFVAAQGFSSMFLMGLQDYVFPLTPSDVLCASSPYFVSYRCENGYSSINGDFISYCYWGSGEIIPNNASLIDLYGVNGALHVNEYSQYQTIMSLHNGLQFDAPDIGATGCTPMDRLDSDTVIGNVFPSFPLENCSDKNISPDLNVRCEENGDMSENVGYFVLVRRYGSGVTGGPLFIASSGMTVQPTAMVAMVVMVFLGFFMM